MFQSCSRCSECENPRSTTRMFLPLPTLSKLATEHQNQTAPWACADPLMDFRTSQLNPTPR